MKLLLPVAAFLGCASAAALPAHGQSNTALSNRAAALEHMTLTARQTSIEDEGVPDDPESDLSDTDSLGSDVSDSDSLDGFEDDPSLTSESPDESLGLDDSGLDSGSGSTSDDGGFIDLPSSDGTFTINNGGAPVEGSGSIAPSAADPIGEGASPTDDTSSAPTPVGDAGDPALAFPSTSPTIPSQQAPSDGILPSNGVSTGVVDGAPQVGAAPSIPSQPSSGNNGGFTLENGSLGGSPAIPSQAVGTPATPSQAAAGSADGLLPSNGVSTGVVDGAPQAVAAPSTPLQPSTGNNGGFTLENGGSGSTGSLNLPPATVSRATCTAPRRRREWRSLSQDERHRYIRAVECMQNKPSISSKHWPVVTSRYEDFVALHANATGGGINMNDFHGASSFTDERNVAHMTRWGIHNVGVFLPWHRYAVWLWETAIQKECGWTEGQPYWDWYLDTPDGGGSWLSSPLFAADAFGGNGKKMNGTLYDNAPKKEKVFEPVPEHSHEDHTMGLSPSVAGMGEMPASHSTSRANNNTKPHTGAKGHMSSATASKLGLDTKRHPGTGGGCILAGPFKQEKLHIGPFGSMYDNTTAKPRCLTRNFNAGLAEAAASYASISDTLRAKNFGQFRQGIEKPRIQYLKDPKTGNYTRIGRGGDLHTIGHSGVGGEMSDLFTSTNDPIFFLHHANIDRLWWLWQSMDPVKRLKDIHGGPMPKGFPSDASFAAAAASKHGANANAHGHDMNAAGANTNENALGKQGGTSKNSKSSSNPVTTTKGKKPHPANNASKGTASRSSLQRELDKIGYPSPLTLESPVWMGFAGADKPVKAVMDIKGMGNKDQGFLCYDYQTGLDVYGIHPNADGKGWYIPPLPGMPNDRLVPGKQ